MKRRPQSSTGLHRRVSGTGEDVTDDRRASRRRLGLLVAAGMILAAAAGWYLRWTQSNPILRIPPVETSGLLPAVAKAIQLAQSDILDAPQSAAPWGQYGLVLLAHGFRAEAASCFEEAELLDADDYRWPYYRGMTVGVWDTDLALRSFERAAKRAPDRPSVRLRLAEWYFDLRRLGDCEREASLALQVMPNSPRAQLIMARLCFERGDLPRARQWAEKTEAVPRGNRRDVHELLARIYQQLDLPEQALEEVARARILPPGVAVWDDPEMGLGATYLQDATLLNTLAERSRAQGDRERCLQLLRRVVETEPHNVLWKEHLAATLIDTGRFNEAGQLIDEWLVEHPRSAELTFLRGQVELQVDSPKQAAQRFEHAIELKPDFDEAFDYLGRALLADRQLDRAVEKLQQAIRLNPLRPEYHGGLSRALEAAEKWEEAASALRPAVELLPDDVSLRIRLAQLLLKSGDRGAAERNARKAVEMDATSEAASELLKSLTDDS